MVLNLINSVELYSNLKSVGYTDGFRKDTSTRGSGSKGSNSSVLINPGKITSEKIGTGVDAESNSGGVYVDVLYPQFSPASPAAKLSDTFKAALDYHINKPGQDFTITIKARSGKPENTGSAFAFNKSYGVVDNGYVITVPAEHLNMLKESRPDTLQTKLYEAYTNNFNSTGSLVNVTA